MHSNLKFTSRQPNKDDLQWWERVALGTIEWAEGH